MREIGLNATNDQQIFIRDHVTSYKMQLFNKCKEMREKFKIKHLWMDETIILIRKEDNSKVHSIKSQYDIEKIETLLTDENKKFI